jgi:calcineurin-like phosphoesterase family protein
MLKAIKFTDTDKEKLFVTGCTHLKHDPSWDNPIWKLRGYDSEPAMTEGIIAKINEVCRNEDNLLILGDFCLNTKSEEFWALVNRINCKLWFVRGNHNNPWEKELYDYSIQKFGVEGVNFWWKDKILYLGDYVELKWNKQNFKCNHYPYYVFDGMQYGGVSLVSHSHGSCKLSHPDDAQMKQIDCGWDVWRRPISFQEIMECAKKKNVAKVDHH